MSYDPQKIICLRKQIYAMRKKLILEYDPKGKKRIQYQLRILEIKIMIEMTR